MKKCYIQLSNKLKLIKNTNKALKILKIKKGMLNKKIFFSHFLILLFFFNIYFNNNYFNKSYYFSKIKELKYNYTLLKIESKYKIFRNDSDLFLPKILEFNTIRTININYDSYILIAVLSSPHNFKKRLSFRLLSKKYCNCASKCKFIFFIGFSIYENENLLSIESHLYNDIVQFSFQNSYLNLTILSIMALKFCFREFIRFDYYIKTDDDISINYPVLHTVIRRIKRNVSSIYGHYSKKFKVNRNKNIGSYIPYTQYPYDFCPEYVYGGFIIMTYVALKRIYYETEKKRNYVWKEDVNLGIICKSCNVSVSKLPNADIKLRNTKCIKNDKAVAVEIFSIIDNFYCINELLI